MLKFLVTVLFIVTVSGTTFAIQTEEKPDKKEDTKVANAGTDTVDKETDDNAIRKQVVKIYSSRRSLNLSHPWKRGEIKETTGTGVWLGDGKILTNAHVVLYSSQLYVQPFDSSDRVTAEAIVVSPEMDLAILKLEDASAFKDLKPLELMAELPKLRSEVQAYGYPTGGNSISVTEGVVSRIEYAAYSHGESGLRIQVDAALNPGNSGGPALVDGQIAGLVYSRYSSGDNIGYLIPAEEIETFYRDVEDGNYDGKPKVRDQMQRLQNKALRARFGLSNDQTGVVVTKTFEDSDDYPLKLDDVLTHIGPHNIDNEGMVRMENGLRLGYHYFVPKLIEDGAFPATIIRDEKEMNIRIPAGPKKPRVLRALKGDYPEYFVYGPLVFVEAVKEYEDGIRSLAGSSSSTQRNAAFRMMAGMTTNQSPLMTRKGDTLKFESEQLIMAAVPLLPHPISKGYSGPYANVLAKINGEKVKNLKHMVQILRDTEEKQVKFEFAEKNASYLVFDRKELEKAMEDILIDNGIARQGSKKLLKEWNKESDD